jgi:hypothetical protein
MDTTERAMSAMRAIEGSTHAVTQAEATDLMRSLQAPPDPHVLRVTVDYDPATDHASVGMQVQWSRMSMADRDELFAAAAEVAVTLRDLASHSVADA